MQNHDVADEVGAPFDSTAVALGGGGDDDGIGFGEGGGLLVRGEADRLTARVCAKVARRAVSAETVVKDGDVWRKLGLEGASWGLEVEAVTDTSTSEDTDAAKDPSLWSPSSSL